MENNNVYTGKQQQHKLQAEKIAVVALQGVRPEKEDTCDHHHCETGEHPRFYKGVRLRNRVSLHRSAHETKIKPDDCPDRQPKSQDVGALDDRKHPDRLAKSRAAGRVLDPSTYI